MKKTRSMAIIFLLFPALSYGSWAKPEIINNTSGNSDCYIYISVNKEKKIIVFKLDPIRQDLILAGEQNMAGEPGSLCADPSCKRMYAALRDINSVESLSI